MTVHIVLVPTLPLTEKFCKAELWNGIFFPAWEWCEIWMQSNNAKYICMDYWLEPKLGWQAGGSTNEIGACGSKLRLLRKPAAPKSPTTRRKTCHWESTNFNWQVSSRLRPSRNWVRKEEDGGIATKLKAQSLEEQTSQPILGLSWDLSGEILGSHNSSSKTLNKDHSRLHYFIDTPGGLEPSIVDWPKVSSLCFHHSISITLIM